MTKLDVKRLRADVASMRQERQPKVGAVGRTSTGAMALVREHLSELEALKAAGATWPEIAAALAAQGVTQGPAQTPITAKRLTSLIASVRRQVARRAEREHRRSRRLDQAPMTPTSAPRAERVRLAPELAQRSAPAAEDPAEIETEYRKTRFAELQSLLKKPQ